MAATTYSSDKSASTISGLAGLYLHNTICLYYRYTTILAIISAVPIPIQIFTAGCISLYTHAHLVPHAEHVENSKWRSSKCCRYDAVLSSVYSVHGSVSEVNHSCVDAQVVSCHRYLVVFHPFVEQLTAVFHTSGPSFSTLRTLDRPRSGIISSTCQRGT